MNQKVLIPSKYNVYMQDLDKDHLELKFLGHVKKIQEARTMVKAFREVFVKDNKNATVFFEHIKE